MEFGRRGGTIDLPIWVMLEQKYSRAFGSTVRTFAAVVVMELDYENVVVKISWRKCKCGRVSKTPLSEH